MPNLRAIIIPKRYAMLSHMTEEMNRDGAGVVILNVTVDELNNSNFSLTDNTLLENTASAADETLEEDENHKLQNLLEEWNFLQLLPVLAGM